MYNAEIRAWKQKEKLVVGRLVHLDVEDCSEELLRQQSYAIKNQRGAIRGLWMPELVLYGMRTLAQASLGKLSTNERRASTFRWF